MSPNAAALWVIKWSLLMVSVRVSFCLLQSSPHPLLRQLPLMQISGRLCLHLHPDAPLLVSLLRTHFFSFQIFIPICNYIFTCLFLAFLLHCPASSKKAGTLYVLIRLSFRHLALYKYLFKKNELRTTAKFLLKIFWCLAERAAVAMQETPDTAGHGRFPFHIIAKWLCQTQFWSRSYFPFYFFNLIYLFLIVIRTLLF